MHEYPVSEYPEFLSGNAAGRLPTMAGSAVRGSAEGSAAITEIPSTKSGGEEAVF